MSTLQETNELESEISQFKNRMNGMPSQERHAEAVVEIAIELKRLRLYIGFCDDRLNEIAGNIS